MNILKDKRKLLMPLYGYQEEVIEELDNTETGRTLLVMPTGTGKTFVFVSYILLKYVFKGERALIIAGSDELLEQAVSTVKMLAPQVSVGKFIGSERDFDSQIIVASLQTIKNYGSLVCFDNDFAIIVYDEAHHIVSDMSMRVLFRFGLCDLDTAGHENVAYIVPDVNEDRELLGVTATPIRTDDTPLGKILHDRVDAPSLQWFIQNGHLCDLKFVSIDTGVDLSDVRSYMGDLSEGDIAQHLIDSGYINELARVIDEYCADRKSILVYLPNVLTTKLAAKMIAQSGISCDYVIGAEKKRRKEVIERFKAGEIRVLVNCLVLKEGFDAPNADATILCRPTRSPLLLIQIIGRVTRKSPGKDIGKIFDLVFKRRQEDILSASSIFSDFDLAESEVEGKSVLERINIQEKRSGLLAQLIYRLDRIRHIRELTQKEDIENDNENEKAQKVKLLDPYMPEDVPDSIQLLVDTRMLNDLEMDFKEFIMDFKIQSQIIKMMPKNDWVDGPPHPEQISLLLEYTRYDNDDLMLMNWTEAQSLIQMYKASSPITDGQVKYLKFLNVDEQEIPRTKTKASKIINGLLGIGKRNIPKSGKNYRRVKRGRA